MAAAAFSMLAWRPFRPQANDDHFAQITVMYYIALIGLAVMPLIGLAVLP
jgi:hypothetical protein